MTLTNFGSGVVPGVEHLARPAARGVLEVPLHQASDRRDLGRILETLEAHHLGIDLAGKIAGFVQHVGDAAGHAGREIASRRPEHDHAPARHVLAAVIADGLDDRVDAAVATQKRSPATPRM